MSTCVECLGYLGNPKFVTKTQWCFEVRNCLPISAALVPYFLLTVSVDLFGNLVGKEEGTGEGVMMLMSGNLKIINFLTFRFKEERSPKPKKKFGSNFGSTLRKSAIGSIRRPNMANFKQKIKSKLRRG